MRLVLLLLSPRGFWNYQGRPDVCCNIRPVSALELVAMAGHVISIAQQSKQTSRGRQRRSEEKNKTRPGGLESLGPPQRNEFQLSVAMRKRYTQRTSLPF